MGSTTRFGEADREADRLTRLIGNLLNMSRLESGGSELQERSLVVVSTLVTSGLDRERG